MEHMDLGIGFVEMGRNAEERIGQLKLRFTEVPVLLERDVKNDGSLFYIFVGESVQSNIMGEVLRDNHGCDLTEVKLRRMIQKFKAEREKENMEYEIMESFMKLLLPGVVNLDVEDLFTFFEKSKRPKGVYLYEFIETEKDAFLPENILLPTMDDTDRLLMGFRGAWSLCEIDAVLNAAQNGTDNILVSFGYEEKPRKLIVFTN